MVLLRLLFFNEICRTQIDTRKGEISPVPLNHEIVVILTIHNIHIYIYANQDLFSGRKIWRIAEEQCARSDKSK